MSTISGNAYCECPGKREEWLVDPVFLAQNNVRHLVIRIRFGDLRHEQLGTCFFPVLRHNHVLFLKRCMADAVEKRQNFNGVGRSLFAVYLENTLFKEKFIHPF